MSLIKPLEIFIRADLTTKLYFLNWVNLMDSLLSQRSEERPTETFLHQVQTTVVNSQILIKGYDYLIPTFMYGIDYSLYRFIGV